MHDRWQRWESVNIFSKLVIHESYKFFWRFKLFKKWKNMNFGVNLFKGSQRILVGERIIESFRLFYITTNARFYQKS